MSFIFISGNRMKKQQVAGALDPLFKEATTPVKDNSQLPIIRRCFNDRVHHFSPTAFDRRCYGVELDGVVCGVDEQLYAHNFVGTHGYNWVLFIVLGQNVGSGYSVRKYLDVLQFRHLGQARGEFLVDGFDVPDSVSLQNPLAINEVTIFITSSKLALILRIARSNGSR